MTGLEYSGYLLVLLVFITPGATVAFPAEVQMSYDVISVEQSKLNSTLTCDEQRNSLQDCYLRNQNGIKYFHLKRLKSKFVIRWINILEDPCYPFTQQEHVTVLSHCLFMYCLSGS